MANLICKLEGVRGRTMRLYDTKCVITTNITAGSVITGNLTDGEKTLFLKDIVGVQFKESGALIGYLQFETSSHQMNNSNSNMFSENTFTFESGKNGITNVLMKKVYSYVVDRIEELKYGEKIISKIPDFESLKDYNNESFHVEIDDIAANMELTDEEQFGGEDYIDMTCPRCGEIISIPKGDRQILCPWCDTEIKIR